MKKKADQLSEEKQMLATIRTSAVLVSTCLLLPVTAVGADSVLFNPKIDKDSVVQTGAEARFRFHPKQWDQSLTANLDEGNVGQTAGISNDLATLLNTQYSFRLSFEASTKLFTWTIDGGALPEPSVITVVENDAFNSVRFNARTMSPAYTVTFTGVTFEGLPGTGKWRPDGSVSNKNDGQRVVAASGLLSDSDWSISGYVSADGTNNGDTKLWLATQQLALLPAVARSVPEPSRVALTIGGLVMLGGWQRSNRRGAKAAAIA